MKNTSPVLMRGATLLSIVVLGACSKPPAPPAAPPPTDVAIVTVAVQRADETLEFSGQVQASRTVQVRAQAAGVITARPFQEGAQVRSGDVLYRIDATTYDADLRGARAVMADAEAEFGNATTNVARLRPLMVDNAVARQDVDNAETALQRARASVENARAGIDRAQKAVSEAVVRAEISGRVGRAALDVGTRVSGPADVLTTIDVIDPVYVSFRPSAEQQFRWRRDPSMRRALEPGGTARIVAVLPDGSEYGQRGLIGYIDPVVDAATGTQEYRATFASTDRVLLPGQFIRVRLVGLSRPDAIVIPQRAVLQQMGRQTVFVVDAANKVAVREVKATSWSGTSWLIESGLTVGERVVVDGVQKIGPGAVVNARQLNAAEPSTTAQTGHVAKGGA